MPVTHRLILLLAAFPSSALIALSVLFLVDVPWGYRFLIAGAVFLISELALAFAMSRIPPRMGPETIPGRDVSVLSDFARSQCGSYIGYVQLSGERWRARTVEPVHAAPRVGHRVKIERVEGCTLLVSPLPVFD